MEIGAINLREQSGVGGSRKGLEGRREGAKDVIIF